MKKSTLETYEGLKTEISYYRNACSTIQKLAAVLNIKLPSAKLPGLTDLFRYYSDRLKHSEREAESIENAVKSLDDMERAIITLHYLEGCSWELTSEKVGYCYCQTLRIANKAIASLEAAHKHKEGKELI